MSKLSYNPKFNGSVKVIEVSPNTLDSDYKLLRHHYSNGDIILIDNFKFDIDYSLFDFQSLKATTDKNVKKPKTQQALLNLKNKGEAAVMRIKDAMGVCKTRIQGLFEKMFPEVTSLGDLSTWRFTHTNTEDYHLDIYDDKDVTFRAFYNLSTTPRVWGFGHGLKDCLVALDIKKEDLRSYKKEGALSPLLNRKISLWLDTQERHTAEFGQHSLWMCDSLKVGHQVVSGDKMVAFSFRAPTADFGSDPVVYRNSVNQSLC